MLLIRTIDVGSVLEVDVDDSRRAACWCSQVGERMIGGDGVSGSECQNSRLKSPWAPSQRVDLGIGGNHRRFVRAPAKLSLGGAVSETNVVNAL